MEQDPLVGKELGAYQIQSKLGEGGMARVYRAYHTRLRREAAIKVISAQMLGQEDFKIRFEREAQVIANLEHPNIVRVFDFGEINSLMYLVMQYVGGGTLHDQMRDGRPMDPLQAANYTQQMARALHHAHLRGIVHRDVKPQNMLIPINNPNQLLLSDFGIAKLFDERYDTAPTVGSISNASSDPALTNADQIVGTASYMAPEQIKRQRVDARTDVYALGVVLFQMLTGQLPFQSSTQLGLMYQHVNTPAPDVRQISPHVPEVLAQITARALEKSPDARFQSAEVMADALDIALMPTAHPFSTTGNDALLRYHHSGAYQASGPATPLPSSYPPSGSYNSYGVRAGQTSPTTIPAGGNSYPYTMPSGTSVIVPASPGKHTSNTGRITGILSAALILVVVAVFVLKPSFTWPNSGSSNIQTSLSKSPATTFTDIFRDNKHGWTEINSDNFMAKVGQEKYTLEVVKNTYFPTPTKVGMLPDNFTLTTQIAQDAGPTAFYGLSFRITYNGDIIKSGYAFIIRNDGSYALFRYDNSTPVSPLRQGHSENIHTEPHSVNTLQATVRGSTIALAINDHKVLFQQNASTYTDTTYTSGYLGLLVAGPENPTPNTSTQFTVTNVQLAIP